MRKILVFALILLMSFGSALATEVSSSSVPSPDANAVTVPIACPGFATSTSPFAGQIIYLPVDEADEAIVKDFAPKAIDFIHLEIDADPNGDALFTITHTLELMEYDWFLINSDGEIVANILYTTLECTCDEVHYDVNIRFAPKWTPGGIYYLVWVK